jgi:hypothetical protein
MATDQDDAEPMTWREDYSAREANGKRENRHFCLEVSGIRERVSGNGYPSCLQGGGGRAATRGMLCKPPTPVLNHAELSNLAFPI